MTAPRGHEFVDHTADLGIRAWGASLGIAFAEAARGLFEYMIDVTAAHPTGEAVFESEADSAERLLHRFLDELLFVHQRDLVVFCDFDVHVERAAADAWRLRAAVAGEAFDEARHGHVHEVKAVTFHGLRVDAGPPSEVFLLVDV